MKYIGTFTRLRVEATRCPSQCLFPQQLEAILEMETMGSNNINSNFSFLCKCIDLNCNYELQKEIF
jgi:hypothetical protein